MIYFDTICVILSIFIAYTYCKNKISFIVSSTFVLQYLADVLLLDFAMWKLLPEGWFFITKAYLLLVSISLLYYYKSPNCFIYLLISACIYHCGMWLSTISPTFQLFDNHFATFMGTNMILQLVFLLGVNTNGVSWAFKIARPIVHRFFTGGGVNIDMYLRPLSNKESSK